MRFVKARGLAASEKILAEQPWPIPLPPADQMRVTRVCIALGAAERCKTGMGYATLELSSPTLDDERPFRCRTPQQYAWLGSCLR